MEINILKGISLTHTQIRARAHTHTHTHTHTKKCESDRAISTRSLDNTNTGGSVIFKPHNSKFT